MSKWEKIANIGTGVSALAALVASGAALYQVNASAGALDDLQGSYLPLMEQMAAETTVDPRVLSLRPFFAQSDWGHMSIEQLWLSPQVQALEMTQDEFLIWISQQIGRGFLYSARCFGDDPRCDPYKIEWDQMMRLPVDETQ